VFIIHNRVTELITLKEISGVIRFQTTAVATPEIIITTEIAEGMPVVS
jgi:hypothetical protein